MVQIQSYDRTKSFQGLRLLFLAGIVFLHAGKPFIGEGCDLCSFFFVVSGFLFHGGNNYKDYISKKALKIFPIYWTCLAFFLLARVIVHNGIKIEPISFSAHLLLLQSYFPSNGIDFTSKYMGLSWFVSSLFFCYITAPIIHNFSKRLNERQNAISILFCIIFCYLILSIPSEKYHIWLIYVNPLFRLLEFSSGLFLYSAINKFERKHMNTIAYVFLLVIYFYFLRNSIFANMSACLHLIAIALIYTFENKNIDNILGNRFILQIAEYGIFIYLTHSTFLGIARHLNFGSILSSFFAIACSIGFGIIYKTINRKLFSRK